jgi:hypothetical protein
MGGQDALVEIVEPILRLDRQCGDKAQQNGG